MEHSFNTEIAQKYGIHEAILYNHFLFWIIKNKANGKNYHDGRYWTYSSAKALHEIFPYLSEKQIRSAIKNLIDNKVLIKANYNPNPYDRTSWYAFNEEPEELLKIQHTEKQMEETERKNTSSFLNNSILPKEEMKKTERENHYTDILTDTLTDTLTDVCGAHTRETENENVDINTPYGLLNYPSWDWESFKAIYLVWFTKLTGTPVSDIIQTVSPKNAYKLKWLEENFKKRVVNAGVAIFDTLEVIAQDKSCINNYRFRASNYLDGVISRLADTNLAKNDPVSDEGTGKYSEPTFDYFKY